MIFLVFVFFFFLTISNVRHIVAWHSKRFLSYWVSMMWRQKYPMFLVSPVPWAYWRYWYLRSNILTSISGSMRCVNTFTILFYHTFHLYMTHTHTAVLYPQKKKRKHKHKETIYSPSTEILRNQCASHVKQIYRRNLTCAQYTMRVYAASARNILELLQDDYDVGCVRFVKLASSKNILQKSHMCTAWKVSVLC